MFEDAGLQHTHLVHKIVNQMSFSFKCDSMFHEIWNSRRCLMSIAFFTQFLGKKVDILLVTAHRGIKELDQCQSLECKQKTKHVNNLKLNTCPGPCFPCQLHCTFKSCIVSSS